MRPEFILGLVCMYYYNHCIFRIEIWYNCFIACLWNYHFWQNVYRDLLHVVNSSLFLCPFRGLLILCLHFTRCVWVCYKSLLTVSTTPVAPLKICLVWSFMEHVIKNLDPLTTILVVVSVKAKNLKLVRVRAMLIVCYCGYSAFNGEQVQSKVRAIWKKFMLKHYIKYRSFSFIDFALHEIVKLN